MHIFIYYIYIHMHICEYIYVYIYMYCYIYIYTHSYMCTVRYIIKNNTHSFLPPHCSRQRCGSGLRL